jgi:hypothetical protein
VATPGQDPQPREAFEGETEPRLIAKFSANARIWRTSFSSCMSAARIEMCAGKAGAGSSSLMTCPRKKGAVSKFQCCLAVACVMAQGGLT